MGPEGWSEEVSTLLRQQLTAPASGLAILMVLVLAGTLPASLHFIKTGAQNSSSVEKEKPRSKEIASSAGQPVSVPLKSFELI